MAGYWDGLMDMGGWGGLAKNMTPSGFPAAGMEPMGQAYSSLMQSQGPTMGAASSGMSGLSGAALQGGGN